MSSVSKAQLDLILRIDEAERGSPERAALKEQLAELKRTERARRLVELEAIRKEMRKVESKIHAQRSAHFECYPELVDECPPCEYSSGKVAQPRYWGKRSFKRHLVHHHKPPVAAISTRWIDTRNG